MKQVLIIILAVFWISGCAPVIAVKKGYDFSQIRKVAVIPFKGTGVSGNVVADDFIRQLIKEGVDVVDREHLESILQEQRLQSADSTDPDVLKRAARMLGVDAFFTGTVSMYRPVQRFLVSAGDDNGISVRPVIELNNSRYYRREDQLDDNSYVFFVGATVSVSARLIDVRTGSVVWANSSSYEALDAAHAVSSIISYFIRTIKPYWQF